KPKERYQYISNYVLEKALIRTAYKICCPEIKVRTLLCNTYQPNNKKKRITLSLEEYQKFVEDSKSVEELKIKIQETKIQLEIVTKPISADNNTFVQFFNDKIQRLATVLYNHQHHEGNKPVLDVDEFTDLIESRDPNLCDFFNLIFQSMNLNTKGRQTKESLKRKVMLLCYQMAALQNKQVSETKNVIGLYMAGTGMSTVGINTLSNMDNYHDLHESRIPSVTSINQISHMATILLNTNNISPIPLSSAFHNPNGVDTNLLKQALNLQYMTGFSISYNTQKFNWSSIKDVTTLNEFDLVETLVVHYYDADLSEKHVRRFDTTKLVDFIPLDLKNMNNYIKALTK
ncbi:9822_t:CDS:2, partial [Diversispora eburnea]